LGIAGVLVLVGAVWLSWHCLAASGYSIGAITLTGLCWQIAIGACGLLAIYLQIRKMTRNTAVSLRWNKRVESLTISAQQRDISDDLRFMREFRKGNSVDFAEIAKKPLEGEARDCYYHLTRILNYFERVAAGIKYDVYDDTIMYDYSRGMACDTFRNYKDFILELRRQRENPRAWKLLEQLAVRWEKKYTEELSSAEPVGTSVLDANN
jgi:hypothetical protein